MEDIVSKIAITNVILLGVTIFSLVVIGVLKCEFVLDPDKYWQEKTCAWIGGLNILSLIVCGIIGVWIS